MANNNPTHPATVRDIIKALREIRDAIVAQSEAIQKIAAFFDVEVEDNPKELVKAVKRIDLNLTPERR